MLVRFLLLVAAACCPLFPQSALVPGEPAPDRALRDVSGNPVRLSDWAGKKHVALLAQPSKTAAGWTDTVRRLAALDTVLLFDSGPAATVLVDRAGIVRRVMAGRTLSGADLEEFVATWQAGKTYYIAHCARCHGNDADEVWCDPNPLIGISHRRTPDEIREHLRMTPLGDEVIIRGESIKKYQVEAILIYVSSL